MLNLGDLAYLLLVFICGWLALNLDGDGGGGGKRARVRI
jgi:hypothetical protein